jgi:outer membrane protein OmpU
MNRKMIGSTAVAALLALSAPANADEKIKLELGGFFVGAAAFTDGTTVNWDTLTADERNHKFGSNSEIHFKGSMILDTGLRIGFKAELELEDDQSIFGLCDEVESIVGGGYGIGCQDPVDEVYMFVEGGFGRIEFGQQDGVGDQFSVTSPRALAAHSVNDRQSRDLLNPVGLVLLSTVNDSSGDNTKINYMTPKLGPVKLGLSYTPDNRNLGAGYGDALEEAGDEILEVALAVDEMFNDVRFQLGASYVTASDEMIAWDNKEWNVGVNVGFGGFTLGGSYRDSEGFVFGGDENEYKAWDAGLAWENEAWKFSGQFGQQEGGNFADPDFADGDTYLLAARYKVTKGFRVGAGFQHDESDDDLGDDGSALILETALKF